MARATQELQTGLEDQGWNRDRSVLVASLVTESEKNLPAMHKTQVLSLDWDDPLEKGMATHSSVLAWRIPWTEEPGRL